LGVLGFLLTAAGLFGMVQYSVNRRTREFGVRIALGAGPGAIQRSVLTESLRIVAPGVVLGLALLAGGAWTVQSFLLGVSPLNPLAYATCAGAAVAFALLAARLPARRATRLDLVEVLRAE
jgi:ABC-type antimicrobial peptide transport system permease subunit